MTNLWDEEVINHKADECFGTEANLKGNPYAGSESRVANEIEADWSFSSVLSLKENTYKNTDQTLCLIF